MKNFPRFFAGLWLAFSLPSFAADPAPARPWNQDVLYFAITDRFLDGDPANNLPTGSDPILYDPNQTNIDKYHGGDFRGLELALQNGYFQKLGVTAIWITPPVRNVWYSEFDLPAAKTGYHGYWAQDFLDIDPHLVSRKSLDRQRDYPDTRDGRMQHYKDFVALAHAQGIKIVQDVVLNHAGPVFYYDANGNGQPDADQREEWIAPFKQDGFYDDARWAENPQWDQHRTAPAGPLTILNREVKTTGVFANLEAYGRKGMSPESLGKSDGEEVDCDFFSLRDFWTVKGSPHFEELVNDFVEVYAFYLQEIGVDGLRIDTVKHVHREFWDAFTERLRAKLGPERARQLILFGEIYGGSPELAGSYTYRSDYPQRPEPCLDSTLDFSFCQAVRDYLRTKSAPFGSGKSLEKALADRGGSKDGKPFYNTAPGLDGLTAAQKEVTFVENHDGLNRFRVEGISERRNLLANALLLTAPGIPCLYYGTETGLQDIQAKIGADSETGRLTFLRPDASGGQFAATENNASFQSLAALIALRKKLPALTSAAANPLWIDSADSDADDGIFAFARGTRDAGMVIVVVNASARERTTGFLNHRMKLISSAGQSLLAPNDQLERIPIPGIDAAPDRPIKILWSDGIPEVELPAAPESLNIYRITP